MKEQFQPHKKNSEINIFDKKTNKGWNADKRTVIHQMITICEDYMRKGYLLSLRQLYYQMVKENYIPNLDIVYKKLSSIKDEAFYTGLIDWESLEDRGRVPHQATFDDDIKSALEYAAKYYRLDRQIGQTNNVEIWTEKDAISSILKRVTNLYGIRLCVNKGYTSSTAIYAAYVRFLEAIEENYQTVTILYFGDHDPSGLDMVRDIKERLLFMFENGERVNYDFEMRIADWAVSVQGQAFYDSEEENDAYFTKDLEGGFNFNWRKAFFESHFKIQQIGLTMEQIKLYNLPPNPAKLTDPRAKGYVKQFGSVSWEVDALSPEIIEDIVNANIQSNIDFNVYQAVIEREQDERTKILEMVKDL